ncbi:MAG TPA: hypothetical protein PLV52_07305, partial [Candidatus Omnitrophota bacterium]|nr:hypothetical protein [Candidatus Omnitrophota bacterium]
ITLDADNFPDGVSAGSRNRRGILDVLEEQGVPIMIPVSPNGIFCANGWEYYVAPLFKHLGIYASDAVCYAYRGVSEKAKRIEIHSQSPSIFPKKEPIQKIPLADNGFPQETTHKKTTRGGKRMLLYVLQYLVERGLVSDVQKARGLDKIDISISGLTRYTRVRIGNFSYLSLGAYLNYLDRCGIRDIEKIRFEITGKKLWISVLTKKEDGTLTEPHLVHAIDLTSDLKPLNIGESERDEMAIMAVLERSGIPLQLYLHRDERSRTFVFKGVAYHIASLLRRLGLDSDDIIVVFNGGDKDGGKRLEIRRKGEPMDLYTERVTAIDLDSRSLPVGIAEEERSDGNLIHIDVLTLQLKMGKETSENWPQDIGYKKRTIGAGSKDQAGFNGIVYQGLQRYIKYLRSISGEGI